MSVPGKALEIICREPNHTIEDTQSVLAVGSSTSGEINDRISASHPQILTTYGENWTGHCLNN